MSAPVSHHPLVVNTADGSCWTRRAVTSDGRGLYALAGAVAGVPDEVLVSLADLAELGIVGSAFALPVPVGPLSFPPAPRTELERLAAQVVELQETASEARRDAVQARRERDLMRERVSEPFGCTHCGAAKRSHGRRYLASVGTHSWERPSDEQVKARMLARRVARSPLPGPELDQALEDLTGANLARWEEEQDNARLRLALASAKRGRSRLRARVAELEAERHSTNEALDDAVQQLRADRDRVAELEAEPLAWAWKLDAKSLDNFLIALGTASEHEPMDEAVDRIHELLRSYREATSVDGITWRIAPTQALRLETGGVE